MEDFEYNGVKLKHVEKHNYICDGCYFWNENISCIPKCIPECNTGVFTKID